MRREKPIYRSIEEVNDAIGGQKVRVYKNLHNGMWSIKQNGLVIGYAEKIALANAKYIVSLAGRARVLREQRKNVHAFVEGYVSPYPDKGVCVEVSYNPYKYDYFYEKDSFEEVKKSKYAVLMNKLFAVGVE